MVKDPRIPAEVEKVAATYKSRASLDDLSKRHDPILDDELGAIARCIESYGISIGAAARAFDRDKRQLEKRLRGLHELDQKRNLRRLTIGARRTNMQHHHEQLTSVAERLRQELSEAEVARRPWSSDTPENPARFNLVVENEASFLCFKEHTAGAAPWPLLEEWLGCRLNCSQLSSSLFGEIVRTAQAESRLRIIEGLLERGLVERGLSVRFAATIYDDALSTARGSNASQLTYGGDPLEGLTVVSWGAFSLALVQPESLDAVITTHAGLRRRFAAREDVHEVVALEERVSELAEGLNTAMQSLLLAGFTESTCSVCRAWLD